MRQLSHCLHRSIVTSLLTLRALYIIVLCRSRRTTKSSLRFRHPLLRVCFIPTFCLIPSRHSSPRHVEHFFKFPAFELLRVFLLLCCFGALKEAKTLYWRRFTREIFSRFFLASTLNRFSANGWKLKHFAEDKKRL